MGAPPPAWTPDVLISEEPHHPDQLLGKGQLHPVATMLQTRSSRLRAFAITTLVALGLDLVILIVYSGALGLVGYIPLAISLFGSAIFAVEVARSTGSAQVCLMIAWVIYPVLAIVLVCILVLVSLFGLGMSLSRVVCSNFLMTVVALWSGGCANGGDTWMCISQRIPALHFYLFLALMLSLSVIQLLSAILGRLIASRPTEQPKPEAYPIYVIVPSPEAIPGVAADPSSAVQTESGPSKFDSETEL